LPENFKGVSFGFANWNKESFTGVSFAALASWNEGDVTEIQF
jgi:hypothetical protein